MKNPINLAAVVLFLVIMGCSCPRLGKLTGDKSTPVPYATPPPSNSTATPRKTPSSDSALNLTLAKFNQLKVKMPKSEVDSILGGTGTEVSQTSGGGVSFSVYKWQGANSTSIIISFREDRIMTKYQVGLK